MTIKCKENKLRDGTPRYRLTIDTNVINSRGRLHPMNVLERWNIERKVSIQGTFRLTIENANDDARRRKTANYPNVSEPIVLGVSFLGESYIGDNSFVPKFDDLARILFPTTAINRLTPNQENDVMHLPSHIYSKADIFITKNTRDFIKGGRREKLLLKWGVVIMTPEEAISDLISKHGWRIKDS